MTDAKVTSRLALSHDEMEVHHLIRHQVFVEEQGLFDSSDKDEYDADPAVRHVLAFVDDVPGGTVRLYRVRSPEIGDDLWKGDRLAVLPEFRHTGLGGPLVRYAVAAASEAGGDRMIAYIQPSNVVFFKRLGWHADDEPATYLGSPHQKMWIELR